jgi:site-specific DNA-methyltransferase (adenine-specific)
MKYQIINGNNIDVLKTFPDNHFDSIVTDPPYGIDFLGKSWDANTGALETYQECLRVLKPGGHILAFSAARTYHHLAITLEQAGFEIRDQIMWIYSSGFPKSQDVGKSIERTEKKRADNALGIKRSKIESGPKTNCPKCNKTLNGTNQTLCQEEQCDLRDALAPADNEWAGWGTALKPAHEPIALARKPIKLSIAKNCQTHGVGALNIDAARIASDEPIAEPKRGKGIFGQHKANPTGWNRDDDKGEYQANDQGRFPSNVIGEIPDYQKYFYCPKVSRRERHTGHEMPPAMFGDVQGCYGPDGERFAGGLDKRTGNVGNNHPTVKPIELMKYLIKLVTPAGGRVLDPFNGSGSTGCAAVELGYEYVGIELDPKYVEIATKRIEAWNKEDTAFKELFE